MFISLTEYNNFLINLNCCISNYASEVSMLLLQGNNCAEEKAKKLFLLNNYAEALCKYTPEIIEEECINVDDKLICEKTITDPTGCLTKENFNKIINNINSLCEFCNCD